jgi:hypothetical protein
MKKLLTTTAIAGSALLMAATVQAQTTVKGQVNLVYKAVTNNSPVGAAAGSYRGFGKETQLDVQTKGKLNNGLDYGAGFSIEHDGFEAGGTNAPEVQGMFNENVYIDITAGKTTFTVGADHIQNPDFTITNLAGFRSDPEDVLNGSGNSNASQQAGLYPGAATTKYGSFGAGIIQDLGFAKASYYYTPGGTAQADTGGTTYAAAADLTESAHEVMLRGDMGVKGLDATLFYSIQEGESPTAGSIVNKDAVGRMFAAKYNFGQITLAGEIKRNTASTAITTEGKSIAAGYAVNKDVTVAIGTARAEKKQPGALTEKNNFVQVGYNLGPVLAGVMISDASDIGGTLSNDAKALYLQLSTAF